MGTDNYEVADNLILSTHISRITSLWWLEQKKNKSLDVLCKLMFKVEAENLKFPLSLTVFFLYT